MKMNTEMKATHKKGSLTIEAALIMPLFMFSMICIISLSALLLFQLRLKAVMHEEVKTRAMKTIAEGMPSADEMGENVLSQMGDQILKIAPIEGGSAGINFNSENYGEEIVCLTASYEAKLYYDLFGLFHKNFKQKALNHDFSGYGTGLSGHTERNEEIYVYVTEDSEVYHTSRECTHIKLKITQTSSEEIGSLRNSDGGKYKSCEHCHSKLSDGILYITEDGDKYHNSLGCSGLKRVVKAVPLEEVSDKRCCSRCGG